MKKILAHPFFDCILIRKFALYFLHDVFLAAADRNLKIFVSYFFCERLNLYKIVDRI